MKVENESSSGVEPAVLRAKAEALYEAATAMEGEDAREWPFSGLDEVQEWLRARASHIEEAAK